MGSDTVGREVSTMLDTAGRVVIMGLDTVGGEVGTGWRGHNRGR